MTEQAFMLTQGEDIDIKHLVQLWIKRGKNGKLVQLHFMTFEIGRLM